MKGLFSTDMTKNPAAGPRGTEKQLVFFHSFIAGSLFIFTINIKMLSKRLEGYISGKTEAGAFPR